MKRTILLLAVTIGYITPTYSQLNPHSRMDATSGQFQNKKNGDFGDHKVYIFIGNYTFYKFSEFLRDMERDSFNLLPARPAPKEFTEEPYSRNYMPCFHPKSGDKMPCSKPTDTFPMRVFKPNDVIWGMLL